MYIMQQNRATNIDHYLQPISSETIFGRSGKIIFSLRAGCFGIKDLNLYLGAVYTQPITFGCDRYFYLKIPHRIPEIESGQTVLGSVAFPAIDQKYPHMNFSFKGCCLIGYDGLEGCPSQKFEKTFIELVQHKGTDIKDLWVTPGPFARAQKPSSTEKTRALLRPFYLTCVRPKLVGRICNKLFKHMRKTP